MNEVKEVPNEKYNSNLNTDNTQLSRKNKANRKRPPNSFLLYCSDQRKILKEKKPNQSATEMMNEMSKSWSELPREEKNEYFNRAKKLFDEFKSQNPDYKYKSQKQKKKKKSIKSVGDGLDSLQLLNHLFQNKPFLLQQIFENKDKSGRPNIFQCIFPE